MPHNLFGSLKDLPLPSGRKGKYYALDALQAAGLGNISRMPHSLRIVLESVLRNCDGTRVTEEHVRELAAWQPKATRTAEIPFVLARILLQDMAGFPALNDFAAMRNAAKKLGGNPSRIEPRVPVDLVVDHSVEVDVSGKPDAVQRNMEMEFQRNGERYAFLKWGKQAFEGIRIVPPGNGIVHQVNLEYLARCVWEKDSIYYPDTLVGKGARALGIYGDSLTTDHISPVAPIKASSPAGRWLTEHNAREMNTFGARRCNHEVMIRGAFANVRIKNQVAPGTEGGVTLHQPSGEQMGMYDAAERYRKEDVPLVVFAGEEYGTGSSRDWAAKGPQLLGIKVVVARSFERIHRTNLIGMGILPCQFKGSDTIASLGIDGTETFDLTGVEGDLKPCQDVTLTIRRKDGGTKKATLTLRADTPIEIEYLAHGGILPYVLREILAAEPA